MNLSDFLRAYRRTIAEAEAAKPNCRGYRVDDPIHVPGSRPGSNCPICEEG
jgi:hypothetical protein